MANNINNTINGMLQTITQVVIKQNSNITSNRNNTLYWNYVISYECNSDWKVQKSLKITLPKRVTIVDANGNKVGIYNTVTPIGYNSFSSGNELNSSNNQLPLIMKGDKITVRSGYGQILKYTNNTYYLPKQLYDSSNGQNLNINLESAYQFEGWVTNVNSDVNIQIEALDNTWLLQQIQMPNRHWNATAADNQKLSNKYKVGQPIALEDILYLSMLNAGFYNDPTYGLQIYGYNPNSSTISGASQTQTKLVVQSSLNNVGDVITSNFTIAAFLDDIKRKIDLEYWWDKNQLHLGLPIYNINTALYHFLTFQTDVIFKSNLVYNNVKDVKLSAIVQLTNTQPVLNSKGVVKANTIDGSQRVEDAYIKILIINTNQSLLINNNQGKYNITNYN